MGSTMTAAEHLEDEEFDDESLADLDVASFVSVEEVEQAKEALRHNQVTLAQLAGISVEEREAVYARGVELLSIGLCKEAAKIFFQLCLLDRTNARYIRTLGLAYHYQRLHRWARVIYGQALVFDKNDVIAAALRAECTLVIIGKREAVKELHACLQMPIRNRHDIPYVERAKALYAKLSVYQGEMK
jgi:Flp pilus assembly protein TadD